MFPSNGHVGCMISADLIFGISDMHQHFGPDDHAPYQLIASPRGVFSLGFDSLKIQAGIDELESLHFASMIISARHCY
jgi:hypothetical protein